MGRRRLARNNRNAGPRVGRHPRGCRRSARARVPDRSADGDIDPLSPCDGPAGQRGHVACFGHRSERISNLSSAALSHGHDPARLRPRLPRGLETLLGSDAEFGPYDDTRWRAFRYIPGKGNIELSPSDGRFRPEPGRTFWLIASSENRVDVHRPSADALSVPTHGEFPIVLEPNSWNQFGNPFAFPVAWAKARTSSGLTLADLDLRAYRSTDNPYPALDTTAVLQPFEGYFVENTSAQRETLYIPPRAALPPVDSTAVTPVPASSTPSSLDAGWALRFRARTEEASDSGSLLGVHPLAGEGRDTMDRGKPPSPPGSWVRVAFVGRDSNTRRRELERDLRSVELEGHIWEIELTSSTRAEPITIQPSLEGDFPADVSLRLYDPEQDVDLELRSESGNPKSYSLLSHGPQRPYRLTLLAGAESWIAEQWQERQELPRAVVLDRSAPNPFKSATRIRFGLPAAERVTLAIYDVRGTRVRTLVHAENLPRGYHARLWDGKDESGRRVANGLYFCQLLTADAQEVRKVLLLE